MNITNITNLFRAYFIENKKRLLRAYLVAFGAAAFVLTLDDGLGEELKIFLIIFTIIIAGTFFQSTLKKNNGVHFFNLPVTAGEKLIHAILVLTIIVIGIQPLLLAGAYVGRYLFHPLFFSWSRDYLLYKGIFLSWEQYLYFIAAISTFLFGSIYYKKNAFWKTLGTGIGFLIVVAFYYLFMFFIAFGETQIGNNSVHIDSEFMENYHFILPIVLTLFFLSLTYLRLRETEV
jgi:hypothetical protein